MKLRTHYIVVFVFSIACPSQAGAQSCIDLYDARSSYYHASEEFDSFDYAGLLSSAEINREYCIQQHNGETFYVSECNLEYEDTVSTIWDHYYELQDAVFTASYLYLSIYNDLQAQGIDCGI